jgi:excisionase family DNA binding protein
MQNLNTLSGAPPRALDHAAPTVAAPRLAISATEASEVLGCSLSTIYRMIRAGQLRGARTSARGRIFVSLQSVRDFVEAESIEAAARDAQRRAQLP